MAVREATATERLSFPYAAIGVIFVRWPDGTGASGTVEVVGRNDLMTATHVVYSPEHGGWAKSFEAYFGADYNSVTGRFDSTSYSYTLKSSDVAWQTYGWPSSVFADSSSLLSYSETQYDIAMIGLSVPIGDTTGWLGRDYGRNTTQSVTEVGYPFDGTGMMVSTVTVSHDNTYSVYSATSNAMGPGSSGGPLLTSDGYLIGVKSSGSGNNSAWADIGFLSTYIDDYIRSNDSMLATTPPVVQTPRYSVSSSASSVNEGSSVVFTITTQNVASGTRLAYSLTGVSASDITGGVLAGNAVVGSDGRASVTVGLAADQLTEGSETLTFSTNGASASVTVLDTSTTPRASADMLNALGVYRAFYGAAPTTGTYGGMVSFVNSSGVSSYAASVANNFAGMSSSTLATTVLSDMGVTSFNLFGSNPLASYEALRSAVSAIFAANASARGQVVLNMTRLLGGLESDTVYGYAARQYNSRVQADYQLLAGFGDARPDDATAGLMGSVPAWADWLVA